MGTKHTKPVLANIEKWWNETDFSQMELITGFRQIDFDSEDGYQDFVDACNTFWNQLGDEEKKEIWKNNN
jgi:hypothetical protein